MRRHSGCAETFWLACKAVRSGIKRASDLFDDIGRRLVDGAHDIGDLGPHFGLTSMPILAASLMKSGSRIVRMNAWCKARKRAGGIPGGATIGHAIS